MDSFIAIDYETANINHESACALGVSIVENGVVLESFESFIKPPEEFSEFDPFNTMIHGITSKDVKKAPSFDYVWSKIENFNKKYNMPFACHYSALTFGLLKHYLITIN